jgi:hypothetical protein
MNTSYATRTSSSRDMWLQSSPNVSMPGRAAAVGSPLAAAAATAPPPARGCRSCAGNDSWRGRRRGDSMSCGELLRAASAAPPSAPATSANGPPPPTPNALEKLPQERALAPLSARAAMNALKPLLLADDGARPASGPCSSSSSPAAAEGPWLPPLAACCCCRCCCCCCCCCRSWDATPAAAAAPTRAAAPPSERPGAPRWLGGGAEMLAGRRVAEEIMLLQRDTGSGGAGAWSLLGGRGALGWKGGRGEGRTAWRRWQQIQPTDPGSLAVHQPPPASHPPPPGRPPPVVVQQLGAHHVGKVEVVRARAVGGNDAHRARERHLQRARRQRVRDLH